MLGSLTGTTLSVSALSTNPTQDPILRGLASKLPAWLGEVPQLHDCFLEESVEDRMTGDEQVARS